MVLRPEYCWDHPWWLGGACWVPAREPRGPHAADGPLLGGREGDTKEQSSSPLKGEKNTLRITEEAANIGPEIPVLCVSDQMHARFFRASKTLSFRE